MNFSRSASFLIVAVVYLLATVAGVVSYLLLAPYLEVWLSLLIADAIATVVTFIFSIIFKNASVYDPYWSVQPIIIVLAFLVTSPVSATGILVFIAVLFWGVRLTANWAYTFHGLAYQDWRYTMLNQKTGAFYPIINFLGIHLFPTIVVYSCVLPAVYAVINAPELTVGAVIFFIVCICAASLQGVADIQMHKFRKAKTGGFIRIGLWKYARHPNYLGEILMWWGVALMAVCAMPSYWWLIAGATLNTLMFCFVSVPLAEGKLSKREGYAEYKKQTRIFLPIKK
ncbi:MAG: DUF1295 domain-containing protein [Clostridiales bacterium]|nr:DUF1295 domain-containing protein [Clostridiales bacterium]